MLKHMYAVLGLEDGASAVEITETYRRLVSQYHPDKNPSIEAVERFRQIRGAYKALMRNLDVGVHFESEQPARSKQEAMRPCRRAHRLTPSHRRFNWQLEEEYKGTHVRHKI